MWVIGLSVTLPESSDILFSSNTNLLPQIQHDNMVYSGEEIHNHHRQKFKKGFF